MKKENCPFCGHRWIRKSLEEQILCPNCNTEYYVKPQHEEALLEDEISEQEFEQEEEKLGEELDDKT